MDRVVVNPDGTGGGGLPVTGVPAGMVALAGLLLVAAGVAAVMLFRQRRTRFVA